MPEITAEESFIEFPCSFPIKVVGTNCPEFHEDICKIAKEHDSSFSEKSIISRQSSAGKYLSLTIKIYATERPTLDAVYKALTDCKHVKWAL